MDGALRAHATGMRAAYENTSAARRLFIGPLREEWPHYPDEMCDESDDEGAARRERDLLAAYIKEVPFTNRAEARDRLLAAGDQVPLLSDLNDHSLDILISTCEVLYYGNDDSDLLRRVGASLAAAGGFHLMQTAFYAFVHSFPDKENINWPRIMAKSGVEHHWHGIGQWLR
jgi:hypothetical protein